MGGGGRSLNTTNATNATNTTNITQWVTNANEMSTNNMKSTWLTQIFCGQDPTQPIFH